MASLVGDWIPGSERGKIFGYILTGELAGAGVGFSVTGDIAALSWRAAFIILALPAFFLAWLVFRLPEPARGGQGVLAPEPGYGPPDAATTQPERPCRSPSRAPARDASQPGGTAPPTPSGWPRNTASCPTPSLLRLGTGGGWASSWPSSTCCACARNVALIVSGACGYYFLAGIQTFGVEFVRGQYGVGQVLANFLLLVVGPGAVVGVLAGGPLGDALLRRGQINGRVMVAAVAAAATVVLFIPALLTHSALAALPVHHAGRRLAVGPEPADRRRAP